MKEERTYGTHYKRWENYARPDKNGILHPVRILEISKKNNDLVAGMLTDFNDGINTSRKGRISPARLNGLRQRVVWLIKRLEAIDPKFKDITLVDERILLRFFNNMQDGIIKNCYGKVYKSTGDYVKDIKTFWNWLVKKEAKEGKTIPNPTFCLTDYKGEKAGFVYLTFPEIKRIIETIPKQFQRAMIWLVVDSGIRSVREIVNVKVNDFADIENDKLELHIRVPKKQSFERKVKLMLCSEIIRNYIKTAKLSGDDYLFSRSQHKYTNEMLRNKAVELLGDVTTKARGKISDLKLYDLRHCSACYWLPRYKNNRSLMFRFGWKKEAMIDYYTEMLGLRDEIQDDDMLVDSTKTELEGKNEQLQQKVSLLQEQIELQGKNQERIIEMLSILNLAKGDDDFEIIETLAIADALDKKKA